MNIINVVALVMIASIAPFSLWLAYFVYRSDKAEPHDYPEAEPHKIAILITARNEAKVIRRSVEGFINQDYPSDKFDVFVVAHNCNDETAKVAESAGAKVIIHNNQEHRCKADAINAGITYINNLCSVDRYEYLVQFDADGYAEPDYLDQMNRVLSSGADIAQEYIIPGNFRTNIVSKLAGILYMQLIEANDIGLDRAGLPVTLYGCGMGIKMEVLSDGWPTETLVDDFELMVREVFRGHKIVMAEKSRAQIEVPVAWRTALSQRRRWTHGDAQCTRRYLKDYIRSLKRLGLPGVKVVIELLMIPLMVMFGVGLILELVVIIIKGISIAAIVTIIFVLAIIYLMIAVSGYKTITKYGYTLRGNVGAVLLSPLWASVMVVFAIESVFVKDIEWKAVPRSSEAAFEQVINKK